MTRARGPGRTWTPPPRGGRSPGGNVLLLLCFAKSNGELLWEGELDTGNVLHMKGNDASPSPVTDGEHVWAVTGNGEIVAFDMDGEPVWRRNLQADYGAFGHNWGYACSPLLHDGKPYFTTEEGITVILAAGRKFAQLAANELDGSYTLSSPVASGNRLYVRTEEFLYCIGE